jgi:hypothetical protein
MVKYKWSLFIGALLFISCSDDEERPVSREWPVRFSSGISDRVESRAANDSWDAGDRVGVYMVPHVADASAAADFSVYTDAVNVPYVTSGSGTSVSLSAVNERDEIVFPAGGSRVNFVAYYPYRSDTHTVNANVYKVNVSDQSLSKTIDLLYHKGSGTPYDSNNKTVSLEFTHQLSKMKISIVPASDDVKVDLSATSLTLSGFPITADFDLSTGVLSNLDGVTASLTPVRDGSVSSAGRAVFEAIVIPHSGTSHTRIATFTINGQAYPYTLTVSGGFKQGIAYNYVFKFTGRDVVLVENTIVNWGGEPTDLLTASQTIFDLPYGPTLGYVTIMATTTVRPTLTLSDDADSDTGTPGWIIGASLSDGIPFNSSRKDYTSYTLTFETTYNDGAFSRTGYIRLSVEGMTLVIEVTQGLLTYTSDGLANCYMVVPGSRVDIPITRAITVGGLPASAAATVETLWDDNHVISGNPSLLGFGASRILTVNTSSMHGNAVVALKDAAGTICWSWHIWVTDYTGVETGSNATFVLMDRNLGATEAELSLAGRGLFYQWGRKDPFPGGEPGTAGYAELSKFRGINQTGAGSTAVETVTNIAKDATGIADGIKESIRKPTTYLTSVDGNDWLPARNVRLWNTDEDRKTIYDPCPVGWRVPFIYGLRMISPWSSLPKQKYTEGPTGGIDWDTAGKHPAAGRRSNGGGTFFGGGATGYYMSALASTFNNIYNLYFDPGTVSVPNYYDGCAMGQSVRCVREINRFPYERFPIVK